MVNTEFPKRIFVRYTDVDTLLAHEDVAHLAEVELEVDVAEYALKSVGTVSLKPSLKPQFSRESKK